jgi:voltage-gated potassium channel Kch
MRNLFAAYMDISRALNLAFRAPRVQALLLITTLVAAAAALIFRFLEGWNFIDSFYFAVVSMATVGYGDLAPKTNAGKLFTIAFLVVGIGLFVLTVSTLAEAVIRALQSQRNKD